MARPKSTASAKDSTATIGFEAKLWLAADKLRNNMDAAEYSRAERDRLLKAARRVRAAARINHVVLGLMVAIERDNPRLKNVLPKEYARPALDKHRLGELTDLIGTISLLQSSHGLQPVNADGDGLKPRTTLNATTHCSVDLLGRVYDSSGARKTATGSPKGERGGAHQYFLTRFASAEGKNGGHSSGARKTAKGSPQGERGGVHQFYTPSCVVRCLVEMLAPYKGRIYDPACGSGGMFVQSEKFVESHGGKLGDISIYGQDKWARRQRPFGLATRARRVRLRRQQPKQSNATTRRLAVMNLALRGIEADFGPEHADTFRRDLGMANAEVRMWN